MRAALRILGLLATSVALLVLGGSLTGATARAGAPGLPSFLGCEGTRPAVRPHSIVFACADGNFYVNSLRWSSWTTESASAVGIGHQNDCTPFCAAGHFHAYPSVSIRLVRPETCTNGRRLFTRITYRFLRGRPPGEKTRQSTLSAPFLAHSGCP
jgi:hypothetical protein